MRMSLRRQLTGLGLAASAVFAATAFAAPVNINDANLTGGDSTTWDATNSDTAYCTPAEENNSGFAPVDDGIANADTDAFDGGMMLVIGNKTFEDGNDQGSLKGQTLKVGPDPLGSVDVTVRATALQGSPTLQVLYGFKNQKDHQVSPEAIIESNLGSDDTGTAIAGTSSGDEKFKNADRWIVTEDTDLEDGPVTHVLYGKQADGFDDIVATPEEGCEESISLYEDGVAVSYSLKIPAHSTRYLLAFAEMHESDTGAALDDVKKFNDAKLSKKLLKGITGNVRSKILNWDL